MIRACPSTGKLSYVQPQSALALPPRGCPSALLTSSCPSAKKARAGESTSWRSSKAVKKTVIKDKLAKLKDSTATGFLQRGKV